MRFYFSSSLFRASLVLCIACLVALPAHAKRSVSDYAEANLSDLTKFAAHYKTIDLADMSVFKEFLKVTDCEIYKNVSNSPFKLQEIQQPYLKHLATQQQQDMELYFRIPVTFRISGYNFDTQSFPVLPDSQFIKVNILELTQVQQQGCVMGEGPSTKVSSNYFSKLNMPISIYRIPVQRDIAESLTRRLAMYRSNENIRLIYGYILLQIEPIQPEIQKADIFKRTLVRGNVQAVDLYLDPDHKIPFKRLDYEENY